MRKVRLCRVFFRVGPSTREILPFLPIVPDGMEYCGFLMYVGQDHHGIQLWMSYKHTTVWAAANEVND
jgi:hypothetical protein